MVAGALKIKNKRPPGSTVALDRGSKAQRKSTAGTTRDESETTQTPGRSLQTLTTGHGPNRARSARHLQHHGGNARLARLHAASSGREESDQATETADTTTSPGKPGSETAGSADPSAEPTGGGSADAAGGGQAETESTAGAAAGDSSGDGASGSHAGTSDAGASDAGTGGDGTDTQKGQKKDDKDGKKKTDSKASTKKDGKTTTLPPIAIATGAATTSNAVTSAAKPKTAAAAATSPTAAGTAAPTAGAPSAAVSRAGTTMTPAAPIPGNGETGPLWTYEHASATDMARQATSLGGDIEAGMRADKAAFERSTPPIETSLPGAAPGPAPPVAANNALLTTKTATEAKPAPQAKSDKAPVYDIPVPSQQGVKDPKDARIPDQPAPGFQATGPADPTLTDQATSQATGEATTAGDQTQAAIAADHSEDRIQPRGMSVRQAVSLPDPSFSGSASQSPEMAQYADESLPQSVRTLTDQRMATRMDATMGQARKQTADATATHERDRARKVEEARTSVDQATADAKRKQDKAVADGHEQIAQHKQDAETETRQTVDDFHGKAGEQHKAHSAKIDAAIADHQKQADDAMRKGQDDAAKHREDGEKQAEDKRKEAEKKKKHRHWWQAIFDFFKKIFNWLKDAINKIIDTVTKAITAVLEAARKAVMAVLNAARKLVVGLINAFATVLKALLTVALAAFPGIRDKLLKAIDAVVDIATQIVNAVVSALESTLNSTFKLLEEGVQMVATIYKVAISVALTLAEAVITGNFANLPMMLFCSACEAANIPPEPLLQILRNAADAFMDIIKNPIGFAGNLVKSAVGGVKKFGSHIFESLEQSAFQWLFGKLAESGITLPKTWDLKSIFMLILEVLGLTFNYVRQRAVALIGEQNMEAVEFVVQEIKVLFTKGPMAVWDDLKAKAGEIKSMIIQAISEWIVTNVIMSAVEKIAPPIVGQIIAAIQAMQAIIENAKRILKLIAAISESMKSIAKGQLEQAKAMIDESLTRSLPLVITALADFVGLSGIAKKVQETIEKVREPVDKAVDFVVKKMIGLAKSAMARLRGRRGTKDKTEAGADDGAAARGPEAGQIADSFKTANGEEHRVYVQRGRNGSELIVNSPTREEVMGFLDKAGRNLPKDETQAKAVEDNIAKARTLVGEIEQDVKEIDGGARPPAEGEKTPPAGTGAEGTAAAGSEKAIGEAKKGVDELGNLLRLIMNATGVAMPGGKRNLDSMSIDQILAQPPAKRQRTMEEQKADLGEAVSLVKRVQEKEKSTDEVAAYFPKITTRFRLTALDYQNLGTSRAGIAVKINPDAYIDATNQLQGAGGPSAHAPALKTKVTYRDARTVRQEATAAWIANPANTALLDRPLGGVFMEAEMLGPEHPKGSNTSSGTGQVDVMNSLDEGPSYKKGHLLNADLGGPGGDVKNLFPITGSANALHFTRAEDLVKSEVNTNKYWMYFKMEISAIAITGTATSVPKSMNVQSTMTATMDFLTAGGARMGRTETVTINSDPTGAATADPRPAMDHTGAGQDAGIAPELANNAPPSELSLEAKTAINATWANIQAHSVGPPAQQHELLKQMVSSHAQFGGKRAEQCLEFVVNGIERSRDSQEKGRITSINNHVHDQGLTTFYIAAQVPDHAAALNAVAARIDAPAAGGGAPPLNERFAALIPEVEGLRNRGHTDVGNVAPHLAGWQAHFAGVRSGAVADPGVAALQADVAAVNGNATIAANAAAAYDDADGKLARIAMLLGNAEGVLHTIEIQLHSAANAVEIARLRPLLAAFDGRYTAVSAQIAAERPAARQLASDYRDLDGQFDLFVRHKQRSRSPDGAPSAKRRP